MLLERSESRRQTGRGAGQAVVHRGLHTKLLALSKKPDDLLGSASLPTALARLPPAESPDPGLLAKAKAGAWADLAAAGVAPYELLRAGVFQELCRQLDAGTCASVPAEIRRAVHWAVFLLEDLEVHDGGTSSRRPQPFL